MKVGYEVFHADVKTLVDFYVDVLSFSASAVEEGATYVAVERDSLIVGCCFLEGALSSPAMRKPPHGSEIVLRVDDVQREYSAVVRSGWPVADELQQQSWGLTDFRLFDPSGQYIRITE